MSKEAPKPQAVTAPLTSNATFLVLAFNPGPRNADVVRSLCRDLSGLVRAVGHRVPEGQLSCIMGFGAEVWDSLFGDPRPAELHKLPTFGKGKRVAVSTPGDIFCHIRAQRMDLSFEFAYQLATRLGAAVSMIDEVHGFRYFDQRSMVGFVDGTENPEGQEKTDATIIGGEDPAFAGGSYLVTQKYLHDLVGWNGLKTEEQEGIIGRTKLTDIELDDSAKPPFAHNVVSKLVENGKEFKILRDNMPFGEVGKGEYGTYFVGYSRSPSTTEKMLRRMFEGTPTGDYDHLLDFSRAVTGNLFFVPSADFFDNLSSE
ncbi:MAG TPA: Dyp-type peroxidase [Nitrososphaerales archaeon]|nr:Dyp-type peroxidase [Nitrososphaerales archaeon]